MSQKGLKEALAAIKKEPADLLKDIAKLINKKGEQIATDAKEQVPVDTGNLRASISSHLKVTGTAISLEVGAAAEYAINIHENPNSKGHKFLEKNFNKYLVTIEKDIKKL